MKIRNGFISNSSSSSFMIIDGREVTQEDIDNFSPVTYIPHHANGNAGHRDCEQGVIVGTSIHGIKVLYCKSRMVQLTYPENLVWG